MLCLVVVWFFVVFNVFFVLVGVLYVFVDELGDWVYFELVVVLCVFGFFCVVVVLFVCIIK